MRSIGRRRGRAGPDDARHDPEHGALPERLDEIKGQHADQARSWRPARDRRRADLQPQRVVPVWLWPQG